VFNNGRDHMNDHRERSIAVFLDFDNVAIGARDARLRFDMKLVLERLLEKGKVLVKKAYADWSYYKDYMVDLHSAAIELIEVPSPRYSGKNSADIRLVVDAIELCYTNPHVDTFVIISGDSDFSPLVSKLRENNKEVIGIGLKASTSDLLISNCDEFIFYDDLVQGPIDIADVDLARVPEEKKPLFSLLVTTIEGLVREHRGALYSSLVKDTMKRKKPDFNEANWGYRSFSEVLEDAMNYGLLVAERDQRAGGSLVVTALGGAPREGGENGKADGSGSRRSSRRRRRRSGSRSKAAAEAPEAAAATEAAGEEQAQEKEKEAEKADKEAGEAPVAAQPEEKRASRRRRSRRSAARRETAEKAAAEAAEQAPEKPAAEVDATPAEPSEKAATAAKTGTTKKTAKKTTKKAAAKKTTTKKTAKKATTKKTTTKKATTKKTTTKKAAKKATTKKTAKKATTKKITKKTAKKATAKKTAKKAATGKASAAGAVDSGADTGGLTA